MWNVRYSGGGAIPFMQGSAQIDTSSRLGSRGSRNDSVLIVGRGRICALLNIGLMNAGIFAI